MAATPVAKPVPMPRPTRAPCVPNPKKVPSNPKTIAKDPPHMTKVFAPTLKDPKHAFFTSLSLRPLHTLCSALEEGAVAPGEAIETTPVCKNNTAHSANTIFFITNTSKYNYLLFNLTFLSNLSINSSKSGFYCNKIIRYNVYLLYIFAFYGIMVMWDL
jgi:hypothetical protein